MKLAALASLALSGCSFGAGSAFVGQWRPHEQIDFDACLVDDAGRCTARKQVTSQVPGRRFWGVITTVTAVGAASVSQADTTTTRARLTPSLEIMKGNGPLAVGVRGSVQLDLKAAGAVPLVVLGHLSLTDRLSVHLGGGYVPFARQAGENAFVGVQGLAGLQLALSRTHSENYIIMTLEADTTWIAFDQRYRSNGVTGHLGVFF